MDLQFFPGRDLGRGFPLAPIPVFTDPPICPCPRSIPQIQHISGTTMNSPSRSQRGRAPDSPSPIIGLLILESIPSSDHHAQPLTLRGPYTVRPFPSLAIVSLTLSSEKIIAGPTKLDSDYQRGNVVFPVHSCDLASPPQICCLVRRKAHRPHRLSSIRVKANEAQA